MDGEPIWNLDLAWNGCSCNGGPCLQDSNTGSFGVGIENGAPTGIQVGPIRFLSESQYLDAANNGTVFEPQSDWVVDNSTLAQWNTGACLVNGVLQDESTFGRNATVVSGVVSILGEAASDCGDGLVQGAEECDDGNLVDGDGCSASCLDEMELAQGKNATQSSTYSNASGAKDASLAIDGDLSNGQHTLEENRPWWMVDLGNVYSITEIRIWNIAARACPGNPLCSRVSELDVEFSLDGAEFTVHGSLDEIAMYPSVVAATGNARYVRIRSRRVDYLDMAEVQVWGTTSE